MSSLVIRFAVSALVVSVSSFGMPVPASAHGSCTSGTPVARAGIAALPVSSDDAPGRVASNGYEAVRSLASALPLTAEQAGRSPSELQEDLLADPSLAVDRCGSPLYIDAVRTTTVNSSGASPTTSTGRTPSAVAALGDGSATFALHSRPGSQRTIYLDFDGADMDSVSWGEGQPADSVDAPAFSFDADTQNFSPSELTAIRETWDAMSEDFAGFDVDVTTEQPSPAALQRTDLQDTTFGTTVVFVGGSGTGPALRSLVCGSCGGIAYLGVFNETGEFQRRYQPALVFQAGTHSSKNLAEAGSHEAGHNLGLSHDGVAGGPSYYSGDALWAPIMGVGYSSAVSTWSSGEYPNANNQEDDLAVITANGLDPSPDDVPDVAASATPLAPGDSVMATISTRQDTDWFRVATGGNFTIDVEPVALHPNVDLELTLLGPDGTTVLRKAAPTTSAAASSPAVGLGASITETFPPGGGYVVVDGGGNLTPDVVGGYSDYGSEGRYRITATGTPTLALAPLEIAPVRLGSYVDIQLGGASGGWAPYQWSIASGALPAGLSLWDGQLVGTPTAIGSFPVTVRITDSTNATAEAPATITVTGDPLAISTSSLAQGTVGVPYEAALIASGAAGDGPSWRVEAGALPPGLELSRDGTLSGTPREPWFTPFTASATDGIGRSVSREFSLRILPVQRIATSSRLAGGYVGFAYRAQLTASGTGALTWSRVAGTLPAGVSLSPAGLLSGIPTQVGDFAVTVRARDAYGRTSTAIVSLTSRVKTLTLKYAATAAPAARTGQGYWLKLLSGSGAPAQMRRVGGALPPGLSISGAGLITGRPTAAGQYTAVVQVTVGTVSYRRSVSFSVLK